MSNDGVNQPRRRFLTTMTTVVGAAGVVGAAVPFVGSWNPSARALAAGAPVKVNIGQLQTDQKLTVEWRGKPVFIVRRSETALENLEKMNERVDDPQSQNTESKQPEYARNIYRAAEERPEIMVFVAICTHLGCVPVYWDPNYPAEGEENWYGGFYCPCHGSKFDLAGRVYKNVPATANLEVPPYRFEGENVMIIGENPGEAGA